MLTRACIEYGCIATTTNGSRCQAHSQERERERGAERRPARKVATAKRKQLRMLGSALCAACRLPFPASRLVVDHIKPLADGGTDTDANLQYLCTDCHKIKTAKEARNRA